MRFLLDACASSRVLTMTLIADGHDVATVIEWNPQASDQEILARAVDEDRVLVTEDNDFGELVFARMLPASCVVRFDRMLIAEKVEALRRLVAQHSDEMAQGAFIVITRSRVRIRLG